MKRCEVFRSSFDRPNLFYEVRFKNQDVVADMAALIKTSFKGLSGQVCYHGNAFVLGPSHCQRCCHEKDKLFGLSRNTMEKVFLTNVEKLHSNRRALKSLCTSLTPFCRNNQI